jgi:predicted house-cleaning noncanonical NTP pyrophosphatase (MazG superfamily)
MGWKIVRDKNQEWSQAHGVSGQWRTCETPIYSLQKKLLEELGEYIESGNPDELYDIGDVLNRILKMEDPDREAEKIHIQKIAALGNFENLIEWSPLPSGPDWSPLDDRPGNTLFTESSD